MSEKPRSVLTALPNDKYMAAMAEIDPQLSPDDEAFKAAVVLLAATHVGTAQHRIMLECGYQPEVARPIVRKFKAARVFRSDGKIAGTPDDFWPLVLCGMGLMQRVARRGRPPSIREGRP